MNKLVRVEFTYDSGQRHWLEGEDAERWGASVVGFIHGQRMSPVQWQSGPATDPVREAAKTYIVAKAKYFESADWSSGLRKAMHEAFLALCAAVEGGR